MRRILALVIWTALAGAAQAAVPVNDGAILDRRTDETAKKVEIKTIQDQVKTYTRGIDCSTRTPGNAKDAKSPSTAPQAGRGTATLAKADPTIGSSPAFKAPVGTGSVGGGGGEGGWTAAPRTERTQTEQVIGGMETVQEGLQPNRQTFERMSQETGRDGTIMEAMDRNSGIRIQTGLTFNQAILGVANLAQAWNVGNVGSVAATSQASRGITFTIPAGIGSRPVATIDVCSAGTTGEGAKAGSGSSCAPRRATDTAGNVGYLLTQTQKAAVARQAPLTVDELQAAIGQYQAK